MEQTKQYCCEELTRLVKEQKGVYFPVGEGEISGSISLNKYENEPMELDFHDGWNFYTPIVFRYCPYCGTKQEPPYK